LILWLMMKKPLRIFSYNEETVKTKIMNSRKKKEEKKKIVNI